METKISGIWAVPYVCEMGIEKHCHIIIGLIETLESAKAWGSRSDVVFTEFSLKKEMADLYLILDKYLDNEDGEKIKRERQSLFTHHQKEDEKFFKAGE